MKWTRERIEKHLYSGEDEDSLGPSGQYGCVGYLEYINDYLTENKLHSVADFENIVNGTYWKRILRKKRLLTKAGKGFGRPYSGCFEDFLDGLNRDFQSGIISDDYKFPKLPKFALKKNKYISVAFAAKLLKRTPRRVQQMANERILKGIYNEKTGKLEKLLTESISDYLKNIGK